VSEQKHPRLAHVNVRLKEDRPDGDWAIEWRQVRACSLSHAIELAQAMPDVGWCYEASWIPGGVET
jgi:hypothetical protein